MAPSPPDGACVQVDDTFGPYAGRACRGGFDFTLLFEESILVMLPHLVVLLVLPWRFWFLVGRARKVAPDKSLLAHLKIVSTTFLSC